LSPAEITLLLLMSLIATEIAESRRVIAAAALALIAARLSPCAGAADGDGLDQYGSLLTVIRVCAEASAAVLANAPIGLVGFGFACSVLHFTAERFGNPGGLVLALLTSLAWSLLMMLAHRPPAAELT